MYSVILATALSMGGGGATAWHHHCHGCWSCHGCWGCHGCHGCWGCHGCHGCWGCHGCHGCWGCYGCSCYGCYGCYSCFGCSGCSCYGCSCYGGVVYSSCYGCYSCTGCFSCTGCYGAVVAAAPAATSSGSGLTPEEVDSLRKILRAKAKVSGTSSEELGNAARLTVKLPADARLFVDHVECPLTSSVRSFKTPSLERGKDYHYTLRVQVRRDGQTLTESRRVGVSAGRLVEVDFNNSETLRTAAR